MIRNLSIRGKVWLVRVMIHTSQFLQVLSGKAPEYTKFQPDQEFSIRSNSSRRRIRINIYEPSGFDKSKSYPVHLNFHGKTWSIF